MADNSSDRYLLLTRLAEEFAERYRKGERPPLKEYTDRYPELAEDIREFFPAMVEIEQVREDALSPAGLAPAPALSHLGDFRIIREVGRGGMGIVYEAEQESLGRRVALKVLTAGVLRDERQRRRFEREARSAAKLHHTNIVPVFGVGEHDGTPYYVMQFIQGLGLDEVVEEVRRMGPPGSSPPAPLSATPAAHGREVSAAAVARSLMTGRFHHYDEPGTGGAERGTGNASEVLRSAPPVAGSNATVTYAPRPGADPAPARVVADTSAAHSSVTLPGQSAVTGGRRLRKLTYWQSVARVGLQVADALEYAHKQGVLHRDVKPSNLLLDLQGNAWVTDFGLAKAEGADNLTHTGDILGTLRYMPPEAFEGRADARSDVYSLGLTLYELIALRPAFDERDRNRLVRRVTTEEPPRLRRLRPDVPRDLATIVEKAADKDPARRYPSAGEMAADLERFLEDEPIKARQVTHRERAVRWCRRNPALASLLGLVALLLVGATVASFFAAAHFNRLARDQAKAASDERAAREDAEKARERAEQSEERMQEALRRAEEAFAKARAAVNDYLTAVSEEQLLKAPGLQGLRAQLLQSALGFYQDFLRERGNDPTLRRELAHVYYRVGEIYQDLRQTSPARQSFAQARRLYEALAAENPGDPDLQDGLARCLERSGKLAEAIAIWEKIVRPEDPRYQADLAWAYNNAAIDDAKDDPAKELGYLLKALEVRERLVRLRPGDVEARRGLGASLNNIAVRLTEKGRYAEALPLCRRAAEQGEYAYRLRPNDLSAARALLVFQHNVARTERALGHTGEAVAAYRQWVALLDRRARDNPDVPGLATEMVRGYTDLAAYLRKLGRLDEAARLVRQGHDRAAEATEDSEPFFLALAEFHLEALKLADAAPPLALPWEGGDGRDWAGAAAVAALRDYTLCGGRNSAWLRPNQAAKQLGDRADFRDLLDRAGALVAAEATAKNAQSTPEEKLAARQEVLANLEALAGPSPTARFALRALAQARQDLGRAYLDLGNVDEARAAFDEALAIRQRLVEENPKSEALRADLTRSQVAAGDLLAAAGRLREAERAWEQGLAVLEDARKANPNSLVIRSTLSEESVHVGRKYGDHGLVAEGARHYRRAFELLTPTSYGDWYRYATLLAEGGDVRRLRELTDRMAARPEPNEEVDAGYRARVLLLDPAGADRHPEAVRRIAENFRYREDGWEPWVRGFAHVRLGQAEKGLPLLETATDPDRKWSAVALAFHQLGRADEAREALRQADLAADRRMRIGLSDETLRLPDKWWEDRLLFRSLRREAHRAIRGRPLPDSPYDRLHRARVLLALDRPGEAEAEFAAAVEIRPDDPEVWLARAGVFARLGRKDRAVADLGRALQLPGADPRPWIDAGRALAEAGEPEKADAAYARAAALAAGGLTPFLEAGWWVAGPYPPTLDLPCPPEMSADPSEPVAAVGRPDDLRWKAVPAPPHSGDIEMGPVAAGTKNGSFYALAHVYSERDRTADLYFRPGTDARLWVNGRLVFGGLAGWRIKPATPVRIPVTLRAGRNTLLAKNLYRDGKGWCECRFTDSPYPRGWDLVELGLWAEGSDAFAEADRSAPLTPWVTRMRILFLLAAGRDEEARRVYAEMVRRYDRSGDDTFPVELAVACPLPPERSAERDRLVRRQEAQAGEQPNSAPQQFWLGYVCYRAARFEEAEKALRRAIELRDDLYCVPLLASTCHHLGRAEEAQRLLRQAEERYAEAVTASLKAPSHRLPLGSWENDPVFLFTLREARALINGREPGPDPNEPALRARALERLAELGAAEDDYAKLVLMSPGQPRLWIDRGRRLGELGRWGEAAKAFARAVKIAPKLPQVWKERGRAYAELGRWDEAAADFARALDLAPRPKTVFPYYPWKKGRGEIEDLVARWDEVFDRVVKLRPDDAALWARRVEHFAAQGRWAETEAALRVVVERFPDDWWAPNLLAKLLLHGGDVEGYRQVCREALERFAGTQDPWAAVNLVRTAALAPAGPHELPQFGDLFRTMTERPPNHFWFHATPALADYRRGDAAGAVKRLSARAMGQIALREAEPAFVDAVRALACQRAGRPAEARDALGRARAALDRQRPRPERGWAYDFDWHNWLQAELLVREAEALIPGAPAVAAEALPPAQEEAARRERKQRADRAATEFALALIRSDIGRKDEAEAALRKVLAEQTKIAAEEPANLDYRSQLADTLQALARFLADSGRADEGLTAIRQAVAAWEELAAEQLEDPRIWANLASGHLAAGDVYQKAGAHADAARAWRTALDLLGEVPWDDLPADSLRALRAEVEYRLGAVYAGYGLFPEAAAVMSWEQWPEGMNVWWQIRAGELWILAGSPDRLRQVAERMLDRWGTSSTQWVLAAVALANGLAPGLTAEPERLRELAMKAAAGTADGDGRWELVGLWEYRTGRYAEAVRRLDTPALRGKAWAKAVLAMAHHRLGRADRAREWLARSEAHTAELFRARLAAPEGAWDNHWEMLLDAVCLHREAHELITGRPPAPGPLERLYQARGYFLLGEPAKGEAELRAAVEARPDDPAVYLARSRVQARMGRPWHHLADLVRARRLAEKAVDERPGDPDAAAALADILLGTARPGWTVLRPVQVNSEGGTTLTVQPDGSVLASGTNPDRDVYTVEAEVAGPVAALRLEALPDSSLPHDKAGRYPENGNFLLSDVAVTLGGRPVPLAAAWATHEYKYEPAPNAIDADPSTSWNTWPHQGDGPELVLWLAEPVAEPGRARLVVRLTFHDRRWKQTGLGRFRLSVTGDLQTVRETEWRHAAGRASAVARLGLAHLLRGDARGAADYLARATADNPRPAAADLLALALARQRLGEKDAARQAYRRAAERMTPVGEDVTLRLLVREAAREVAGLSGPDTDELTAAAVGEPPAALTEAIEKQPGQAQGYRERGDWYARRGLWRKAADDLARACEREPGAYTEMQLGALLVQAGDLDRYREHCRGMLARWGGTARNNEADRTVKTCLLRADSGVSPDELDRLAGVAVSGDPGQPLYHWFLLAKGLHAYRAGKFGEAAAACRESRRRITWKSPLAPADFAVEAMALHRAGDAAGARRALEEARRIIGEEFPDLHGNELGDSWHDWLIAHLLFREAEALVGKEEPVRGP